MDGVPDQADSGLVSDLLPELGVGEQGERDDGEVFGI